MMATVEQHTPAAHHTTESPPATKRRKHTPAEHDAPTPTTTPAAEGGGMGWGVLQPLLENDVLCAKIPTSGMAFDLLAKWFQIIVGDQEKLRVFRQWVLPTRYEASFIHSFCFHSFYYAFFAFISVMLCCFILLCFSF
jgi:hypothetical protein